MVSLSLNIVRGSPPLSLVRTDDAVVQLHTTPVTQPSLFAVCVCQLDKLSNTATDVTMERHDHAHQKPAFQKSGMRHANLVTRAHSSCRPRVRELAVDVPDSYSRCDSRFALASCKPSYVLQTGSCSPRGAEALRDYVTDAVQL